MPRAVYQFLVDWGADGTYGHAYADISGDVIGRDGSRWSWTVGRSGNSALTDRSEAGRLSLPLYNDDGKYSSFNVASPIYGLIRPGLRVKVLMGTSSADTRVWTGRLDRIVPDYEVGRIPTARLTALGGLSVLRASKPRVARQTDILCSDAMSLLWDAAGWTKTFREAVLDLNPSAYWRLGPSGAVDETGNVGDGTNSGVTTGETGLLVDDPDTCFLWDGASGTVTIPDDSDIQDVWANPSTLVFLLNADSDGESNMGVILHKVQWNLHCREESGGAVKLGFVHLFNGGANAGQWNTTDRVITIGQTHIVFLSYDNADPGNAPTLYIDNVEVALTQTQTPSGSADSDVGDDLTLGNNAADSLTFDGHLDELAIIPSILTEAERTALFLASLEYARDIQESQTTMSYWTFPVAGQTDGLTEAQKIEATEFGWLRESQQDRLVFEDRHYRLTGDRVVSQKTYADDGAAGAIQYQRIPQDDPIEDVYNRITALVPTQSLDSLTTLWTLASSGAASPYIGPGETRRFVAEYPTPNAANGDIGAVWTTPVASADYTANSQSDGGGADLTGNLTLSVVPALDRMVIILGNPEGATGAYLTLLQARGQPVQEGNRQPLEEVAPDSIDQYGEREYPIPAEYLPDTEEGVAYCRYVMALHRQVSPRMQVRFAAHADSDHLTEALTRYLSDRITMISDTATQLGLADEDMFVERIDHEVIGGGNQHWVTLALSSADKVGQVIVLDTGPGLDTGIFGY